MRVYISMYIRQRGATDRACKKCRLRSFIFRGVGGTVSLSTSETNHVNKKTFHLYQIARSFFWPYFCASVPHYIFIVPLQ